jgi:hypothetical protein
MAEHGKAYIMARCVAVQQLRSHCALCAVPVARSLGLECLTRVAARRALHLALMLLLLPPCLAAGLPGCRRVA